ncbi:hypothetical protein FKM82_026933 [Ascaphus truei]
MGVLRRSRSMGFGRHWSLWEKSRTFKGVHTPSGWSKRVKDGSAAMPEQWLQTPQTLTLWTLRNRSYGIPKFSI